jgi:enoyl-CoA hydratase/carnithine racemase
MSSAREALDDGVADRVVPPADLDRESIAIAESIASNGPIAVRLAKRAIDEGLDRGMDEALAIEWDCYRGVLGTEDRVEALRAFAEKRAPSFRGR